MENTQGPEKYICFKLNKVRRKIHRYYESELAPFDITPFNSMSSVHYGIKMK